MLSKELKLGLSVGGALLAVLIVYVLVVPSEKPAEQVQLITNGEQVAGGASGTTSGGASSSSKLSETNSGKASLPPVEIVGAGKGAVGTVGIEPIIESSKPAARNETASANSDVWEKALTTGRVPLMATGSVPVTDRGPAPAPAAPTYTPPVNNLPPVEKPAPTTPSSLPKPNVDPVDADAIVGPTTVPSGVATNGTGVISDPSSPAPTGKTTTHVVQPGESLAQIAAEAYGNQAYWPHIARANPTIVPEKIKAGITLIMPDPADVKPAKTAVVTGNGPTTAPSNRAAAEVVIVDSRTQYRVGTGDSLYRISLKLYGKGDQVEKIYALNKDVIGADPAKLKLGTILKLPAPPTVASVSVN